jgi:hypothetical protein
MDKVIFHPKLAVKIRDKSLLRNFILIVPDDSPLPDEDKTAVPRL